MKLETVGHEDPGPHPHLEPSCRIRLPADFDIVSDDGILAITLRLSNNRERWFRQVIRDAGS